jgi:16S rRNA processing protein RimM
MQLPSGGMTRRTPGGMPDGKASVSGMQVIVGRIGRPHGVRGDVVVGVRTDEPDARFVVGAQLDTDPAGVGPLTVAAVRWQSGELIVRFRGITDRTVAGELTGTWLSVDSRTLDAPADPDEFRDYQLIDLTVRTTDGEVVGVVSDVLHHGQDLLAIRPAADPRGELLVPFVKAIVTEVDVAGGTLVIDPPPGLLNPDEAE